MFQIDKIQYLQIGVQGENVATDIEIDMSTWAEKYPNAVFHILFKPYNATAPSPMESTYEDGVLTWTVGVGATAVVGVGYTEIRAQDAETGLIKKTRIIPTSVDNSVSGVETTPPASYQEWVTAVLNAGTDAKNSAAAAMAYSQGKQIKFEIGDDEDPDGMAGHLLFYFKDEDDEDWEDYLDLGPVDVYAMAVATGYTGTKAQWVQSMNDAESNAQKAEKYAVGKVNGTDVGDTDPTYHNNSKYYSEQAADSATAAAAAQAAAEAAAETDLVAWLEENITNPDSPPLDRTLSSSSSATPADITGDLKSALYVSTGCKQIEMTTGAYYDVYGDSITIGSPTSYATEKYALVPCSEGDVFTVSGSGGGSARPWAFVNSSGTILMKQGITGSNVSVTDMVLVAPANAAYLVLNNKTSDSGVSYYGAYIKKEVQYFKNNIKSAFGQVTGNRMIDFIQDFIVDLDSSPITLENGKPKIRSAYGDNAGYRCAIVPCSSGDVFTVNATSSWSKARVHGFIKSDGTIRTRANASASDVQRVLTAQDGDVWLVINTKDDQASYYGKSLKDSVDDAITGINTALNTNTVMFQKTLSSSDDIDTMITPGMFNVTNDGTGTWKPEHWPLNGGGNFVVFGSSIDSTLRKTQVIYTQKELLYRIGTGLGNWYAWQYIHQVDENTQAKGTNDIIKSLAERVIQLEQEAGINTIPSYYESHIAGKISDINTLRPTTGDQFVFITDIHVDGYANKGGNTKHSHALINEICKKTMVSKVINGGDVISPGSSSDIIDNIDEMRRGINYTQTDTLAKNYFVGGNHDLGASNTAVANLRSKQLERLANLYSPAECDIVYDDNNRFQYYFDDTEKGIRFIMLCMGMTAGSGMTGHTWWESDAVSFANCIDFYIDALESTPSGYHIIVFNHMSGISTTTSTGEFDSITSANYINYIYRPFVAYQQKTTWSYSGKSKDFSNAAGIPACMIFGHAHRDVTGISGDIVEDSTSIGGTIPLFVTTTDNAGGAMPDPRTTGGVNEQAFDVFTIDKTNRKIYATRIGGGSDRTNSGSGYSY